MKKYVYVISNKCKNIWRSKGIANEIFTGRSCEQKKWISDCHRLKRRKKRRVDGVKGCQSRLKLPKRTKIVETAKRSGGEGPSWTVKARRRKRRRRRKRGGGGEQVKVIRRIIVINKSCVGIGFGTAVNDSLLGRGVLSKI